jgi:hypothetical protein
LPSLPSSRTYSLGRKPYLSLVKNETLLVGVGPAYAVDSEGKFLAASKHGSTFTYDIRNPLPNRTKLAMKQAYEALTPNERMSLLSEDQKTLSVLADAIRRPVVKDTQWISRTCPERRDHSLVHTIWTYTGTRVVPVCRLARCRVTYPQTHLIIKSLLPLSSRTTKSLQLDSTGSNFLFMATCRGIRPFHQVVLRWLTLR